MSYTHWYVPVCEKLELEPDDEAGLFNVTGQVYHLQPVAPDEELDELEELPEQTACP
jgi:hypothetical protein